jgi:hypothetical protein
MNMVGLGMCCGVSPRLQDRELVCPKCARIAHVVGGEDFLRHIWNCRTLHSRLVGLPDYVPCVLWIEFQRWGFQQSTSIQGVACRLISETEVDVYCPRRGTLQINWPIMKRYPYSHIATGQHMVLWNVKMMALSLICCRSRHETMLKNWLVAGEKK